jgi:hypothetical protein
MINGLNVLVRWLNYKDDSKNNLRICRKIIHIVEEDLCRKRIKVKYKTNPPGKIKLINLLTKYKQLEKTLE